MIVNWQYTRKLHQKIAAPHSSGVIEDNQHERDMRLITTEKGSVSDGLFAKLFWLIDLLDASVVDSRYLAFGPTPLIGALEGACELAIGKTYDQASRIGADLIDHYFRDKPDSAAFPKEDAPYLNFVVDLFDHIRESCKDIPLPTGYITPLPHDTEITTIPNWLELPALQQKALIEDIIEREIRPYIELDAGGITLLDIVKGQEVIISYQGSCTSCYSATGSTLSAIQQILRTKVHPQINVIPKM